MLIASGTAPALAQSCVVDIEPNDAPGTAQALVGATCLEGTLTESDQDLAIWEVLPSEAGTRWTFSLSGIPTTLTALKLFEVTSEPGVEPPTVVTTHFLEVEVPPDSTATAVLEDVMLPVGRYLLGISRSVPTSSGGALDESYQYRIERGAELPPSADIEPNDKPEGAAGLVGEFSVSGDLDGSLDYYVWSVPESGERWGLELQVPVGEAAALELRDPEGRIIDEMRTDTVARSLDLQLAPGDYTIGVSPRAYEPTPYVVSATLHPAEGEPEPNDQTVDAIPVTDGTPLKGRLAGHGDVDRFRLDVPGGESMLRDVRVKWRSGLHRELCLLDGDDTNVVCAEGLEGAALTNLALGPGAHVFELSGPDDHTDAYLLRVDATSAAVADFEAEPNEDVGTATPLDPDLDMRARGGESDKDVFRLRTEGEAQLWQIDLTSDERGRLEWLRPSGNLLETGEIARGEPFVRLTDLYLVPGDHWFRVRGVAGEYSLSATPLGPPDPDAEREPNGEELRAERYRIGSRRLGRLPTTDDADMYRFSVAAPQHIALHLEQPPDARTRLVLRSGRAMIGGIAGRPEGEQLAYDLWLQPGDYLVELRPEAASEGRYELTSERLDPFALRVDQEPNDGPAWAQEVPASLSWQGDAVDSSDEDWFWIPPLVSPEPLRILVDDERATVRLMAGGERVDLDRAEDGAFATADAPLGVPLSVVISADGPYRASIEGGGLVPLPESPPPPLELSWDVGVAEVAAYWPEWQHLAPNLVLENTGPDALDLVLEATTSHYLWGASPVSDMVRVPAGGSVSVPIKVGVADDAWAGESVLVSVRATASDESWASSSITLAAQPDAPPVSSGPGWDVPDELLGGIDYALTGLGAVPGGTVNDGFEPQLFDGVTPEGGGFGNQVTELPVELIVDLAGDVPIPVAGIILNPQARDGSLTSVPRAFELLLSVDGAEWQSALTGELSPLPVDQPFVLDDPVTAGHAMLRIVSLYDDRPAFVALGEWKVIAVPGTPLPDGAPAISHPAVGGHVVSMLPASGDRGLGDTILDAIDGREFTYLDGRPEFKLVVGFHEGRTAAITELEWADPQGSDPGERLEAVDVSVSRRGPLGPWELLGRWDLTREADGTVGPFRLDEPVWARFIRLGGRAPADARALEMPASLAIMELKGDEDYRSIIGEWGYTSPRGPFEWLTAREGVDGGTPGLALGGDALADAADRREDALALDPGLPTADRVEIDIDEDWYRVVIPDDHDTLELAVEGLPSVRVDLQLFDSTGARKPMDFEARPDGSVLYEAEVGAGEEYQLEEYQLRVYQPPFSAVFTFDTSGSMGLFRDIVNEGMRSFAAEVRPGSEAVTIVPFEEPPLLPAWEDDAYLLQDAVNRHDSATGSSGAEAGLIDAMDLLADRAGARAILLVTDAETSTHGQTADLWERLERVRPIIFSVHVGAQAHPVGARNLMQDWAASGGGHYVYPTTHGEMDRAFDRMATWLRRPADYTLSYSTLDMEPARLAVAPPTNASGAVTATPLAPGVGVEIILDTSGSMRKKLRGERRIDIAKASLRRLVKEVLAEDVPVAIRTFGGPGPRKRAKCATSLTLPLGPLDRAAALGTVKHIKADKKTGTPIAAAIAAVPADLAGVDGLKSVVLITDGAATCGGDVLESIAALGEAGIAVKLDIVGFALEDEALKSEMAGWAVAGGGAYYDATDAAELARSVAVAVSAPFRVYGSDAEPLAAGTVGGEAVELDPGSYRVEVLTEPPVLFDGVELGNGASVTLELGGTDE